MSCFSQIWARVFGRSARMNSQRFKERSLRIESLEDRALLSVAPGPMAIGYALQGNIGCALRDNIGCALQGNIDGGAALIETAAPAPVSANGSVIGIDLGTTYSDTSYGTGGDRARVELSNVNQSPASVVWDLAGKECAGYTVFTINADDQHVYLYGQGSGDPLLQADIGDETSLTLLSDNNARDITISSGALINLDEILYIGGKSKNDTITLEGTEVSDNFEISQETLTVDVRERPGKTKTQNVVFETVTFMSDIPTVTTVKMSGITSVTIDGKDGDDWFSFHKLGTTYNLIGGDDWGGDTIDFWNASAGVKLNMGLRKAQSVISRQSGKICLLDDFEIINGSLFNDTITTTANTRTVYGSGGSDTVNLVGDTSKAANFATDVEIPETYVELSGGPQKVTAKGYGSFIVEISEGTGSKSKVNASAASGALYLSASGNNIRVTGSKGDDEIAVSGNRVDVRGNDGNDRISVSGTNARVSGGNGDDFIELTHASGKNTVDAGDGNDFIVGSNGNDTMKAKSGRNVLIGWDGADTLIGGSGSDLLIANITKELARRMFDTYEFTVYETLREIWLGGDRQALLDYIGFESVGDKEKDTLKRGNKSSDNLFYANPLQSDFDTVKYDESKGDILYTESPKTQQARQQQPDVVAEADDLAKLSRPESAPDELADYPVVDSALAADPVPRDRDIANGETVLKEYKFFVTEAETDSTDIETEFLASLAQAYQFQRYLDADAAAIK